MPLRDLVYILSRPTLASGVRPLPTAREQQPSAASALSAVATGAVHSLLTAALLLVRWLEGCDPHSVPVADAGAAAEAEAKAAVAAAADLEELPSAGAGGGTVATRLAALCTELLPLLCACVALPGLFPAASPLLAVCLDHVPSAAAPVDGGGVGGGGVRLLTTEDEDADGTVMDTPSVVSPASRQNGGTARRGGGVRWADGGAGVSAGVAAEATESDYLVPFRRTRCVEALLQQFAATPANGAHSARKILQFLLVGFLSFFVAVFFVPSHLHSRSL